MATHLAAEKHVTIQIDGVRAGHPHEGCRSDVALSLSPLTGFSPSPRASRERPFT